MQRWNAGWCTRVFSHNLKARLLYPPKLAPETGASMQRWNAG